MNEFLFRIHGTLLCLVNLLRLREAFHLISSLDYLYSLRNVDFSTSINLDLVTLI